MQIDLATHIEKLLFQHDTLNIPGFGGFVIKRAAASTDYVGGAVHPPAKALTFDESRTFDDGLLVQEITSVHSISSEEARQVVQDFVEKTQAALNQREIVTLPGVGRLYKNYVQQIQFLPDATNFDTQSFGLPPLQFSPIARSRNVPEGSVPTGAPSTPPAPNAPAAAAPPAAQPPAPPPPSPVAPAKSGGDFPTVWVVVGLLVFLGAAVGLLWWLRQPPKTEKTAGETTELPAKKEQPAVPIRPQRTQPAPANTKPGPEESRPAPATESSKPATAKPAPPASNGRTCILIVATLREKVNADRLAHLLESNGYTVYSLQKNGYQVGIQFPYQNVGEIQEQIIALQKLTGEKEIWIKQR